MIYRTPMSGLYAYIIVTPPLAEQVVLPSLCSSIRYYCINIIMRIT